MNNIQLTTAQKFQLFELMLAKGGSFAKSLAQAWFLADPRNKAIIEENFWHIHKSYIDSLSLS